MTSETQKKRILVSTWVETYEFVNQKAKKYGCSASGYAGHVLNQHYLDAQKNDTV